MLASCRGHTLRVPDHRLGALIVVNQSSPQTTETPAALRNCRGFRGKGGHDPQADGKGANRFRSTALCPSLAGLIGSRRAHTKPLHL